MGTGRGQAGPSKSDRRQQARETARRTREQAERKARRRRTITQSGVIVGVVAALAIVGVVIFTSVNDSGSMASPKNMLSGGVLLQASNKAANTPAIKPGGSPTPAKQVMNKKTAHIQIWLDYQCPICAQFETTNASHIEQMMASGTATLEIHPVAILDSARNRQYSTRAAAAIACVANTDPDKGFRR